MEFIKNTWKGFYLCMAIAIPSFLLGKAFPVIGGPVTAILAGMIVAIFLKERAAFEKGIAFTSKKVLQAAVVLLGFGLNLSAILKTGSQSLPIIISTISVSLIIAYLIHRLWKMPPEISTLIGVGSSICGGSAVAAAAPVIGADDEEVAQAISVIFLFNVLAAILFPSLGALLGFSTTTGDGFGMFAGTAINDTSSVTAAASTWDTMYCLGSSTLDTAVTVKLTRTLAIIPITLVLAIMRAKKERDQANMSIKNVFPMFILYFILASIVTTVLTGVFGVEESLFTPFKELSKFMIVLAMAAIGLNTNLGKLIKSGGKPIFMGFCCWIGISMISLLMQHLLGIW